MRGLLKAGLLFAPVLTVAYVVPPKPEAGLWEEEHFDDLGATVEPGEFEGKQHNIPNLGSRSIADRGQGPPSVSIVVNVPVLSKLEENAELVGMHISMRISTNINQVFNIDVLKSDEVCDVGKVLVNGQLLAQKRHEGKYSGYGPITVGDRAISASWDIECVVSFDDEPRAQFLTFAVNSVDELGTTKDAGFTVLFRQHTEEPAIMSYSENTLMKAPKYEIDDMPHNMLTVELEQELKVDEEIADLEWLEHQLRELEWQIAEKKQNIHRVFKTRFANRLAECDSVKCIGVAMLDRAKGVAHQFYSTLRHGQGYSEKHHRTHKRPNSGVGHCAHGNVSHPHSPTHGNNSFPNPPHFRRPHRLPICHFSPSPHRHVNSNGSPRKGEHPPPPPEFRHPSPRPHRSGPLATRYWQIFHVAEFFILAVLASFLVAALYRCCCNASRRASKQARRQARHRRHAHRRTAYKQAWMAWASNWCSSIPRPSPEILGDYEEKRAMLAEDSEGDMISSEIRQIRNAVMVVDDIVAAEEGRITSRSSIDTALPEYLSDAGDSLPSYDETEREVSSMVSDGFRPADYTSSISDVGSVRSVLGDVKE